MSAPIVERLCSPATVFYAHSVDDGALLREAADIIEALLAACEECLRAELARRSKLLPGAPATTYTQSRVGRIEAAITKARS